MKKPTEPKMALNPQFQPDSITVRDYGRHPDMEVGTFHGGHNVVFTAPNGRTYNVSLEGNNLRVASVEGGLWLRPRADNVVTVANVTPFEREVEEGLGG